MKVEPVKAVSVPIDVWNEITDVLDLMRHKAFSDPAHHERVKSLGEQIGFGALMSTAEAGWREVLESKYGYTGGEFVQGPCRSTIDRLIAMVDAVNSVIPVTISPEAE